MKNTNRITGGRNGFARAINEAFAASIHNPTVRYSAARGFHVESAHTPADDDVVWSASADYRLDLGGRQSLRACDYDEVRTEILEASK